MQLCPLRHGPNGPMMSFLVIIVVLTIRGIGLILIMLSKAISLYHGEVPCCAIMVSRRSSSFEKIPSVKFPRERPTVFLASLFSY
jgi:hypothetical protein